MKNILLPLSLIMNAALFLYFLAHLPQSSGVGGAGVSGMTIISKEAGKSYVDGYGAGCNGDAEVRGGILTKDMFDDFFANKDCNAISYYLCRDTTGKILPPKELFILFHASNLNENGKIVPVRGTSVYIPANWCASECGLY
jgi:hypothetical protein